MTVEEEKAEKYIRTDGTNGEKVWSKIHKEFPNCIVVKSTKSKERLSELLFEYTRVVYLDGLTEGKPKWHILKENPNDLPKNREEVLLYVKLHDKWERECILIGYRDFGDCLGEYCKDWGYVEPIRNYKYDFVDGEEVIAWCEKPKFKE